MDEMTFFLEHGAQPTQGSQGPGGEPPEVSYNFGVQQGMPRPMIQGYREQSGAKAWDGVTNVSAWEVFRQVTGADLPAQNQPRGTCVGRGCSGAGNLLQTTLIARGSAFEYKPLSHAWLYGGARARGGMLNSWEDGAIGRYAALWGKEKGVLFQSEAVDPKSGKADVNYYGKGSDDIAVQWGYYGPPSEHLDLAKDNPFKEVASCQSADDAASVISNFGVVTIASDQGFTMTRDADGFCAPKGTWFHQMYLAAVGNWNGRRGFGCGQSWGVNTPNGPKLVGCPDYVFGIDWNVADKMLKQRDSEAISAFAGWPSVELGNYGLI
jgi:hypothetical protein